MREQDLTIDDFKRLVSRVKCINLFHYNLFNTSKLEELCKVISMTPETDADLDLMDMAMLVWYVDASDKRVWWDAPGATNMNLGQLVRHYVRQPAEIDDKLKKMIDSMRDGLSSNVELICVSDTTLEATILADGVYRALALYYLHLTEPDTIVRLLNSDYSIRIFKLSSPAGALLFPCDFVNICRDKR